MPYADTDGASLYYELRGPEDAPGTPVLFIRGLARSLRYWLDFADGVAASRRLLLFDNRGLGRSWADSKPFTVARMADDTAAVLDAAGIEQAHVFGISLGGMVAQEFVLRHPGRARSLVLGATTPGPRHGIRPAPQTVLKLLAANALPPEKARAISTPLVLARLQGSQRAALEQKWAEFMSLEPPPRWTVLRQLLAAQMHDTWTRLDRIDVPTLCLTGGADRLIPKENSALLAERIPGAEILEMAGCGHDFVADDTRASGDIVRAFFDRHEASA